MKQRAKLDQYYTDPKVIQAAVDVIRKKVPEWNELCWIDFSAGNNDFLNTLKPKTKNAFDLDPQHKSIKKMDWFNVTRKDVKCAGKKDVAIGFNPPYGHLANLAVRFTKHSVNEFNPKYLVLLSPLKSFTYLRPKYSTLYEKMVDCAFYTVNDRGERKEFCYRVPLVVLKKRKRILKQKKCKTKYYELVGRKYAQEANFAVNNKGRGAAGWNIYVKNNDGTWDYYRKGVHVASRKLQNIRDIPYNTTNITFLKIDTSILSLSNVAKNFHKHLDIKYMCRSTPCSLSNEQICKMFNKTKGFHS